MPAQNYLRIVSANLPDGTLTLVNLSSRCLRTRWYSWTVIESLAASTPSSFSHFVSTSRRLEPFCITLPYQSWPSLLKNQLMKILLALGCGGSLTTPSTPKLLLAGKPSLGAGAGLIGRPALTNGSAWLLPMPKAIATLPFARTSASCRKSRVKKSSCWTNFLRNSSPLTSHMNDHTDCPELGTRGSLKPILSFHLGER